MRSVKLSCWSGSDNFLGVDLCPVYFQHTIRLNRRGEKNAKSVNLAWSNLIFSIFEIFTSSSLYRSPSSDIRSTSTIHHDHLTIFQYSEPDSIILFNKIYSWLKLYNVFLRTGCAWTHPDRARMVQAFKSITDLRSYRFGGANSSLGADNACLLFVWVLSVSSLDGG